MNKVTLGYTLDTEGRNAVSLEFSCGSVFLKDGTPTPGVALNPEAARQLGLMLIGAAQEVDKAIRGQQMLDLSRQPPASPLVS